MKFLGAFGLVFLMTFSVNLFAETNYLQLQHQAEVNRASKEYKNAKSDYQRGYALELKAGALNSLKKSDEALQVINEAMRIDDKSVSIGTTKAKILFTLNRTEDAIATFNPYIIKVRQDASSQPEVFRRLILGNLAEGFLIETFIFIQQEQWDKALAALKEVDFAQQGAFAGVSPFAYRAMLYQYILMRTKYTNETIPELAQAVNDYEDSPNTYYGYIIKLLKGQDVKSDFIKHINKLPPAEKQDALAEWLFYEGAYKKYAMADDAFALRNLEELNKLAPYGNIEWINATRQFVSQE